MICLARAIHLQPSPMLAGPPAPWILDIPPSLASPPRQTAASRKPVSQGAGMIA